MMLILVRHGEAVDEGTDPKRPLSLRGREDVLRTAQVLKDCGCTPSVFLHSTKLRAKQTAEILQGILNPSARCEEKHYLSPNDPVEKITFDIEKLKQDALIAGHMPFLAVLVEDLVRPEDRKQPVGFPTAGAMILKKEKHGWLIHKVIPPVKN